MFNKDKKEISILENENKEITPMVMLQMAEAQGAPVEQLERLWALNEKVEAANAKKAYTVAMSNFRAECPSIIKTKQGHNSKYAGLAETIDQIKDLLSEYGLSHSWRTSQENGNIKVECIVTHVLGHSESTSLISPPETSGNKSDIQGIGSAVEYMKRYTFFAILGLSSADEDNDGNSRVSFEQAEELEKLADEAGVDKGKFLVYFQAGSFNHIPAKQYKNAKAAIKAKTKKESEK